MVGNGDSWFRLLDFSDLDKCIQFMSLSILAFNVHDYIFIFVLFCKCIKCLIINYLSEALLNISNRYLHEWVSLNKKNEIISIIN